MLVISTRAGVLNVDTARLTWRRAIALFGHGEVDPQGEAVLGISLRDRISACDAQFVAVAEHLGVPLVTADRAVLRARPDLARSLQSFAHP